MSPKTIVIDLAERAAASFLQVFLGVLLAAGALGAVQAGGHVPWLSALDQGGFAAVVAVLSGLLALRLVITNRYADLAWRVAMTFGGSLLATFSASQTAHSLVRFHWSAACYVAFIAAVGALTKGLAGLWTPTLGASLFTPPPAAAPGQHEAPGRAAA